MQSPNDEELQLVLSSGFNLIILSCWLILSTMKEYEVFGERKSLGHFA
jgi:hypothetical protein